MKNSMSSRPPATVANSPTRSGSIRAPGTISHRQVSSDGQSNRPGRLQNLDRDFLVPSAVPTHSAVRSSSSSTCRLNRTKCRSRWSDAPSSGPGLRSCGLTGNLPHSDDGLVPGLDQAHLQRAVVVLLGHLHRVATSVVAECSLGRQPFLDLLGGLH